MVLKCALIDLHHVRHIAFFGGVLGALIRLLQALPGLVT